MNTLCSIQVHDSIIHRHRGGRLAVFRHVPGGFIGGNNRNITDRGDGCGFPGAHRACEYDLVVTHLYFSSPLSMFAQTVHDTAEQAAPAVFLKGCGFYQCIYGTLAGCRQPQCMGGTIKTEDMTLGNIQGLCRIQ